MPISKMIWIIIGFYGFCSLFTNVIIEDKYSTIYFLTRSCRRDLHVLGLQCHHFFPKCNFSGFQPHHQKTLYLWVLKSIELQHPLISQCLGGNWEETVLKTTYQLNNCHGLEFFEFRPPRLQTFPCHLQLLLHGLKMSISPFICTLKVRNTCPRQIWKLDDWIQKEH